MRKTRDPGIPELDRLELMIRRLAEAHDGWRRRAEAAEARVRELEGAMHDLAQGRMDPVAMTDDLSRLERQNHVLRDRLTRAHAAVERIRARLQFTEEER